MRTIATAVLLAAAAGAASGQEGLVSDLRVSAVSESERNASTEYRYTAGAGTKPSGTYADHAGAKHVSGLSVGYALADLRDGPGLVLGVAGDYRRATDSSSGTDLETTIYSFTLEAGLGFPLTDRLHLEVAPLARIGRAAKDDLDAGTGGFFEARGKGAYLAAGGTVGIYAVFLEHLEVGLDVSLIRNYFTFSNRFPGTGASYEASNRFTTVGGALSVGYRF